MRVDIPKMLKDLTDSGMKQDEVSQAVGKPNNYYWRLRYGHIKHPSHDNVCDLIDLYRRELKKEPPLKQGIVS